MTSSPVVIEKQSKIIIKEILRSKVKGTIKPKTLKLDNLEMEIKLLEEIVSALGKYIGNISIYIYIYIYIYTKKLHTN